MRCGGAIEITNINNKININTVKDFIETVPKLFPNFRVELSEKKDSWLGFWPCSPDGLSYISSSKKIKNLIIAGGHPLMGFSLSPATGKLV